MKNKLVYLLILIAGAVVLRFVLQEFLAETFAVWVRSLAILAILGIGAVFVLRGTAKVIEETTDVLQERTKLAGGLLQSLGTAFPDMVLGIVAAVVSLSAIQTDYARAIDFAIIAAATTFGSNIYNIGHATWCVFRQNMANVKSRVVAMVPGVKSAGFLRPMKDHPRLPSRGEIDTAISVSTALTILTAVVALGMVIFGQVSSLPSNVSGDLYQLIWPVGAVVLVLAIVILYTFRKTKRGEQSDVEREAAEEEKYYRSKKGMTIWIHLILAGVAILMAAESMVQAIEVLCHLTGLPFVVAGVLAGMIGCLGEIIVVHNFSVNPKGRIGDAVVGVAMDNMVTIVGASIVALMGGIFLGGNSLILIFVVIFALNALLVWQISKLKNYLVFEHQNKNTDGV